MARMIVLCSLVDRPAMRLTGLTETDNGTNQKMLPFLGREFSIHYADMLKLMGLG